jgi:hypothetical protein
MVLEIFFGIVHSFAQASFHMHGTCIGYSGDIRYYGICLVKSYAGSSTHQNIIFTV